MFYALSSIFIGCVVRNDCGGGGGGDAGECMTLMFTIMIIQQNKTAMNFHFSNSMPGMRFVISILKLPNIYEHMCIVYVGCVELYVCVSEFAVLTTHDVPHIPKHLSV